MRWNKSYSRYSIHFNSLNHPGGWLFCGGYVIIHDALKHVMKSKMASTPRTPEYRREPPHLVYLIIDQIQGVLCAGQPLHQLTQLKRLPFRPKITLASLLLQ